MADVTTWSRSTVVCISHEGLLLDTCCTATTTPWSLPATHFHTISPNEHNKGGGKSAGNSNFLGLSPSHLFVQWSSMGGLTRCLNTGRPNVHSTLSAKSHRYWYNFTADEQTSSCSINWSNTWQNFCATQTNNSCKAKTWLLKGTVLLPKWIITQANPSM